MRLEEYKLNEDFEEVYLNFIRSWWGLLENAIKITQRNAVPKGERVLQISRFRYGTKMKLSTEVSTDIKSWMASFIWYIK